MSVFRRRRIDWSGKGSEIDAPSSLPQSLIPDPSTIPSPGATAWQSHKDSSLVLGMLVICFEMTTLRERVQTPTQQPPPLVRLHWRHRIRLFPRFFCLGP